MSMTLTEMKQLSIEQLTQLPATQLLPLQQAAANECQQAQATKHWLDQAIAMKYQDRAQALRQQVGKDTGVIHFDDDGVRVTTNLPKKPSWDQTKLATIAKRMLANGEDPENLIDINYKISERKYVAWPQSLQADFSSARTLGVGKATFQLSNDKEEIV